MEVLYKKVIYKKNLKIQVYIKAIHNKISDSNIEMD